MSVNIATNLHIEGEKMNPDDIGDDNTLVARCDLCNEVLTTFPTYIDDIVICEACNQRLNKFGNKIAGIARVELAKIAKGYGWC